MIPHIPFVMNFTLLDGEMMDLRLAFERIMDEEGKINVKELYYNMEKRGFRESEHIEQKLLYGILSKIMDYKELSYDKKIDFDELIGLLLEAMNTRKKRKDVSLLFDIFDPGRTGRIESYDLSHVSRTINNELNLQEIKDILNNCSTNKS